MVHKISNWVLGYVRVKVEGEHADRFINLCKNHGIFWWDISWDREKNMVYGCIRRKDLKRLHPVAEKVGTYPEVLERHGGYFLAEQCVKRASFWCGIACFTISMFYLSGRIWGIEVDGQSYHTRESILRLLEAKEVYGGMKGEDADCGEIEEVLRNAYPDVGWASVEKSGSKLYIQIDEMLQAGKQEKQKKGSLASDRRGTVLSIITRKGTARVRAGDRVKKGQVLISGRVPVVGDNEELVRVKKVRAQGTVVLQSHKKYRKVLKKTYMKRDYSGRFRQIYQYQAGDHSFFFYNPLKSLETYEKYDIIREGGCICPALSLRFPLFLWKETFLECNEKQEQYTAAEAERLLQEQYAYRLVQMEERGCFDISGELTIAEESGAFIGTADVIYSKKYE